MVLKKKSECLFGGGGFHVPTIPRGPRSSRRRVPNEKKVDDNDTQICPFELLASLAGKLLQESESSASSNASEGNNIPAFGAEAREQEIRDGGKLLKEECFEHGSSEESAFIPEFSSEGIDEKKLTNASSEHTPSKSDFVHKADDDDIKPVICKTKSAFPDYSSKVDGDDVDNGRKKGNRLEKADLTMADTFDSSSPMELQVEFSSTVKLDNDVKLSLREAGPNGSFSRHRNNIKLVGIDDDENFSRYNNKLGTKVKAFRPQTHVGDHRIRKFLTSKYWKVAPKLRDSEVYRSDGGKKTLYNKRKHYYYHDRGHYETMNKRKRLYGRRSGVSSDGGFSSESVTNSPEKAKKGDTSGSNGMFRGATGMSPSLISRQSLFHSNESHVKLSIKSFKIPEVYIELPETATVGSLKRTVMEAITAIIGGGLQVGVLLEGEKIRDDNITLLQTGISCKDNLDNLGFTLEPNTKKLPLSTCSDEPRSSLPCDTTGPLTSSPGTPFLDSVISEALPELPHSATTVENVHDAVSSHSDLLANKTTADSRALVVLPPISVEALAVVPATPKSRKSSELVQRRTRRPFSVTEVEALVHAVEELGTGRWRDVKLRAFEDADHRTYVDLKDKWKTLVHTATISPQQRRGEPVPQELLDRVLAAHSYWSEHQAKQHAKPQVGGGHGVEGNGITVM